ncbi:Bug family tripartite tricarboxylate transporter substrate binding protein [Pseudothauera rhizosphaerae]|uniref:Tripartite tricarboxylate transporter substrate binding protein n=1 Tax=Pseudothauera rhizosphaerae TaxID=2565932 RepID=A0A4S4B2W3_9RHOO|nr:tripartite tricarboxylate transporter substrate binding protein [Pseudothauera rhizosphaerae]THF65251.1 tripartite tricarboxylate transporter substrate binding protein [Pseudothauera rhizosphaerae]
MNIVQLFRAAALALLAVSAVAHGQAPAAYPNQPIHLLVPFSAGGGQDIFVRQLLPRLQERLGQPVVVENRPGASGNIAAEAVARAVPDGYTLLLGTAATHGMNQALQPVLPFDAQKSFEPVAHIADVPLVLVVHPSVPASNVDELVSWLKADPGRATYGSSGTGAPLHLAGELFKRVAGVEALHVPYKGSAPAIVDLIAGRIHFMFDTFAATNPHVRSGALRRIGVAAPRRARGDPDLPTLGEQGYAVDAYSWSAVFAPAGTPPAVVARLADAFAVAANDPALGPKLGEIGFEPVSGSGPDELRAFVASELKKWADVVRAADIKRE